MLGGGGEEFSIMTIVYPYGTVSVSSLGSFLSFSSSSKPSHPYFPLSLRARHIQKYFKNKREGVKNSLSHIRRRPGMRSGLR